VGAKYLLAFRASEHDVRRGLVDQIDVDGDSAWLVDQGRRVPVTSVEDLKGYGQEMDRLRMGVRIAERPLFFDPTRLTIDSMTAPGVLLNPNSPLPTPPVLAPSR
jgi:hypothetical protein